MKLKDLVTTCGRICQIDADVRDYSNGHGYLIDKFIVGAHAHEDRILDEHLEPRWKCIKEPINYKDIGKDYWGVITKNIPKQLLDMEVHSWDLWDGWTTNNGLNKHMQLMVHLDGKDECILIEEKPKAIDVDDLIDGQMSIEEFVEART